MQKDSGFSGDPALQALQLALQEKETVFSSFAELFARSLDGDRAVVLLPSTSDRTLRVAGWWGFGDQEPPAVFRLDRQATSLASMALRFGLVQLVWSHQPQDLSPEEQALLDSIPFGTLICCHLQTGAPQSGLVYTLRAGQQAPTVRQTVLAAQVVQSLGLALQRQQQDEHGLLQQVMEHAPDIILLGKNMLIERVNRAFTRLLGYLPEEVVGRPVTDFAHPDDVPGASDAHLDMVRTGQPGLPYRVRWLHKDGHAVNLEWTFTPLPDRRGIAVGRLVPAPQG